MNFAAHSQSIQCIQTHTQILYILIVSDIVRTVNGFSLLKFSCLVRLLWLAIYAVFLDLLFISDFLLEHSCAAEMHFSQSISFITGISE